MSPRALLLATEGRTVSIAQCCTESVKQQALLVLAIKKKKKQKHNLAILGGGRNAFSSYSRKYKPGVLVQ